MKSIYTSKVAAFAFPLITMMGVCAASTSQAFVGRPGSFIASRCGATNNEFVIADVKVTEVCVGSVDGADSNAESLAVTFKLSNDAVMMFKVKSLDCNFVAFADGHSDKKYHLQGPTGEKAEMTVTVNHRNELVRGSGSMGTIPFLVPEFSNSLIAE